MLLHRAHANACHSTASRIIAASSISSSSSNSNNIAHKQLLHTTTAIQQQPLHQHQRASICRTTHIAFARTQQPFAASCRALSTKSNSSSSDHPEPRPTTAAGRNVFSLRKAIRDEIANATAYMNKGKAAPKLVRDLQSLDAITAEQLREHKAAKIAEAKAQEILENELYTASMKQRDEGVDSDAMSASERAEAAAAAADDLAASPAAAQPIVVDGPKALMTVDDMYNNTVWDKRLQRMGSKWRTSVLAETFRNVSKRVKGATRDTMIAQQLREGKAEMSGLMGDVREVYETSQNRKINMLRSVNEKVFGETEQSFAMSQLLLIDPHFSLLEFIEDLNEYMIPAVIKAFRRGSEKDQLLLATVVEEAAEAQVRYTFTERRTSNSVWDDRILDIRGLDIASVAIENDQPKIVVSFICQHVNCIRNRKSGAVTEGTESDIQNVYYQWVLRRDFENELFDWKIEKFASSRIYALV